jgi:DNA-binding MarR family transcriptional regulator
MPEDSGNFDIAPLLMLAARIQMAQMMKRLAVLGFDGLTPAFASVMALLDAKGSRATVLAQKAGVTKQAMSQFVKLLEQRDYVEQVADPTDTRAKVIRLTKRGIALRRACEDVRKELAANALKTLGKKDLSKLHQDLNRLIASIRNSGDDK